MKMLPKIYAHKKNIFWLIRKSSCLRKKKFSLIFYLSKVSGLKVVGKATSVQR